MADLQDIIRDLKSKKATLRATEKPIDTSTPAGKAFLDVLDVFAQFETNLRRERQTEGIAKAKARGVYQGRKSSIKREDVVRLLEEGIGPSAVARQLKISRTSVWRLRKERAAGNDQATAPIQPTKREAVAA